VGKEESDKSNPQSVPSAKEGGRTLSRWLEKIYERLWGQVGGRPWTEIVRDDQRRTPLLYMLVFLALGMLVGKLAARYW
jgi:hypothetical protein